MTTDDETFPLLEPDDPAVQARYLRQLKWRYPKESQAVDQSALENAVREGLKLCLPLRVNDPKEIRRFLALIILLTPAQKRSRLLTTVVYRVLTATDTWGARKRLNFIYKLVIGRVPPNPEPDFGVWFVADPSYYPAVTPQDLDRCIFNLLESSSA